MDLQCQPCNLKLVMLVLGHTVVSYTVQVLRVLFPYKNEEKEKQMHMLAKINDTEPCHVNYGATSHSNVEVWVKLMIPQIAFKQKAGVLRKVKWDIRVLYKESVLITVGA